MQKHTIILRRAIAEKFPLGLPYGTEIKQNGDTVNFTVEGKEYLVSLVDGYISEKNIEFSNEVKFIEPIIKEEKVETTIIPEPIVVDTKTTVELVDEIDSLIESVATPQKKAKTVSKTDAPF